jgi:hypothetical protein
MMHHLILYGMIPQTKHALHDLKQREEYKTKANLKFLQVHAHICIWKNDTYIIKQGRSQ